MKKTLTIETIFDQKLQKGSQSVKYWNLSSKAKKMIDLESLFSNLKVEHHVETVRLDYNNQPSLTKLITLPIFMELQTLNLGGNNITNLQSIISLQADKLSAILLWNNKITNIGALRKAKFPNLKIIDFTSNHIKQVNKLTELYSKKMQRVNLNYNSVANLSYLCKIQNFCQNGTIVFISNPLIQILGKPLKKNHQIANKCILKNSRMPDITYS